MAVVIICPGYFIQRASNSGWHVSSAVNCIIDLCRNQHGLFIISDILSSSEEEGERDGNFGCNSSIEVICTCCHEVKTKKMAIIAVTQTNALMLHANH